MDKIPRLTSEQRENLVAYLDGELSEAEARDIDQVLARSQVARHDVEVLARTWDLLDELPRLNASPDFTARTLTVVRTDAAPRARATTGWTNPFSSGRYRRGAILASWVAGLAACAVAGFLVTNRLIPDRNADLLRDLPTIERLDLYSNVGSVEFLRELEKRNFDFEEGARHAP